MKKISALQKSLLRNNAEKIVVVEENGLGEEWRGKIEMEIVFCFGAEKIKRRNK